MVEFKYDFPKADKNIVGNFKLKVCGELNKVKNINIVKTLLKLNLVQPINKKELIISFKNDGYFFEKKEISLFLTKLRDMNLIHCTSPDEAKKHNNDLNKRIIAKHKEYLKNTGLDRYGTRFDVMYYYYLTDFGYEIIPFTLEKIINIKFEKVE